MNKTKIICSIGPSCDNVEVLEEMAKCGMNVARFNMSHGSHESHRAMMEKVKEVRKKLNLSIGIMLDTKGPEIRLKKFDGGQICLNTGENFTLTTRDVLGNKNEVAVTYKNLPKILKKGERILLNDGAVELEVEKLISTDCMCKVVAGGVLSDHKSINLPGVKTDMPYLSEQDKSDLKFAKEMDVDFLSLSFVSDENDVKCVREYLREIKFSTPLLIAKIESEDGVKNFDKILNLVDGVMVARGDLGVEVEFIKLPLLQKEFIKKCNEHGKISITATQMLESMIFNKRPTRAEVSDVANAIFDGSTAIMLSGETASGKYPTESVKTMQKIAETMEANLNLVTPQFKTHNTSASIGYAVCSLAQTENVKAINVATKTGATAKNVSRFHPRIPIVACTPNQKVFQQMSLLYGVVPVLEREYKSMDDILKQGLRHTIATNLVKSGDKVVQTGGKAGMCGSNLLTVKKVK